MPLQLAWLFRVRGMAAQQRVPAYAREKLLAAVEQLKNLILAPEETRHVPRILAEAGVRLVFVEPMPGSKLDGACFWLATTSRSLAWRYGSIASTISGSFFAMRSNTY